MLRAAAGVSGIDLSVHVGEFNAYAQELLDPQSELYAFEPDVVFLAVQTREVVPELWSELADLSAAQIEDSVERVVTSFGSYIDAFRGRAPADLVIHGLELPLRAPSGLLGDQVDSPIARINTRLRQVASERPGVWFLDYDALVARHGRIAWHDERRWLTMRMPLAPNSVGALADEWLRFLHPLTGRVCKALVCDLDNTLWGGVIGEDGIDGIGLGVEYPGAAYMRLQRVILDLHQRGIIIAICSKNNLADAQEVLEKHPDMLLRPKHFAALRINWNDKAQNLREIAAELNIGTDALAFIDDNPAECEFVRSQRPEVTVIEMSGDPMGFADRISECPLFERLTLSAEDRERGKMYAEQRERLELQHVTASLDDFLHSLEMKAAFSVVTPATLVRAAQLTRKTNQFNLTTRRYSDHEMEALAADPAWIVYTVQVTDRFGDNGIVGVMIAHDSGSTWEIDTFLMSCRTIGRTVETAMLSMLAERAAASGARKLNGWFRPTRKNAPAADFYAKHGFECTARKGDDESYELELVSGMPVSPEWIECRFETRSGTRSETPGASDE
ncbi:MAG: HAD-IIIC family phosphatase [Myxococcota bacterium]